ncbi:MAG: PQQ-dependent sugar dehydrogenase [Verrucomicrobiota bacterium]|nr:PQQ-dependent sugar dehydrogenase [Verrucomicrobiota bacterium]
MSNWGIKVAAIFCFIVSCGLALGNSGNVNRSFAFPDEEPSREYSFIDAFPTLSFNEPVAIATIPGETNRLFVVERQGVIVAVTNLANPTTSVFLDLRGKVHLGWVECGLLGLAFHPGYETNGYFFVFKTVYQHGLKDQVSRFQVSADNPGAANPDSETVLIDQYDESELHNGGDLHFGPDGYLYISIGYEGPAPADLPPLKQSLEVGLFGGLFRIDVDSRPENLLPNPHPANKGNYRIPKDNPYLSCTNFLGAAVDPAKVRTEYFALGFRNPWRFGIDPETGRIFTGDVGADYQEEINEVVAGGNYGWPFIEGDSVYENPPVHVDFVRPVLSLNHGYEAWEAGVVIGGVVYRGTLYPNLDGHFLSIGFKNGHLWATPLDNPTPAAVRLLLSEEGVSAFGSDPRDGSVLVTKFYEGSIRKLVYVGGPGDTFIPQTLEATGLFTSLSPLVPSASLVPYSINVPFWSDNAIKERWVALNQHYEPLQFGTQTFNFPEGTLFLKHFELEKRTGDPTSRFPVETRVLIKTTNHVFGLSYRWNSDGTTKLVGNEGEEVFFNIDDSGIIRTQRWHFPGRQECKICHTKAGGHVLGFNAYQLNLKIGELNQLNLLSDQGVITNLPTNLWHIPHTVPATNHNFPLTDRARAYFFANCSHCHQPGAPSKMLWDARYDIPLESASIVNGIVSGAFDANTRVIAPHSTKDSMIHFRIAHSGSARMPPFGTALLDTAAIKLIEEWIKSFPQAPWTNANIGPPKIYGSFQQVSNDWGIAGSGIGINQTSDSLHWMARQFGSNALMIARFRNFKLSPTNAASGLLVRQGFTNSSSTALGLLLRPMDYLSARRLEPAANAQIVSHNYPDQKPEFLKIVREGGRLSSFIENSGSWELIDSMAPLKTEEYFVGIATHSSHEAEQAYATYDSVAYASLSLKAASAEIQLPDSLHLLLSRETEGVVFTKYRVVIGTNVLLQSSAPDLSQITISNLPPGSHELRVVAHAGSFFSLTSNPVAVSASLPSSAALKLGEVRNSGGDWLGRYGTEGYAIPEIPPITPAHVVLVNTNSWLAYSDDPLDPRLLKHDSGRIKTAYSATPKLEFDLTLADYKFHRVTLYFVDAERSGIKQRITVSSDGSDQEFLVRNFQEGVFVEFAIRGSAQFSIINNEGGPAILNGLFIDPVDRPTIQITHPLNGESYPLPTNLVVKYQYSGEPLKEVKLFLTDAQARKELLNVLSITNLLAGPQSFELVAQDIFDQNATSSIVTVTGNLPAPEISFLSEDWTTLGDWKNIYGKDGFLMALTPSNLPPFLNIQLSNARPVVWFETAENPIVLQAPFVEGRRATVYFDPAKIDIKVQLRDGLKHQLALYLADLDFGARTQRITFKSLEGQVLDTRLIGSFSQGVYLNYDARGEFLIEVERAGLGGPVISAIFLDSPFEGFRAWGREMLENEGISLSAPDADPDFDQIPNFWEYALGLDPKNEDFWSPKSQVSATGFHIGFVVTNMPPELVFFIESSTNLLDWSSEGSLEEQTIGAHSEFSFTAPASTSSKFYRLRVVYRP